MAILKYTTSISVDKTIAEIHKQLIKVGATKILTDYDNQGNIISLSFQIPMNEQMISFTLPTDWKPVLSILQKDPKVPRSLTTEEQARRVAWRITLAWVEAQVAIIQTKMVTTAQVFLPYVVTNDGDLMYQRFAKNTRLYLSEGSK